jgi:membrane dipeptidase
MKVKIIIICLLITHQIIGQSYKKIHANAIVVDTHNDILMKAVDQGVVFDQDLTGKTHSDLARWNQGGLDVQLFSVYCDGAIKNPWPTEKWIVWMLLQSVTLIKL